MVAFGLGWGCQHAPANVSPPPTKPQSFPKDTQLAAFHAGDCYRCHEVPDIPTASRLDSCTYCHIWIKEVANHPAKREKALEFFPLWERYEQNVATYLQVPSLAAAMARLDPYWVRDYLADPHDIRPNLPESMPRLGLSSEQREAMVYAFSQAKQVVPTTPTPTQTNVDLGAKLFKERGCQACHTFGNLETTTLYPFAPDLAHTRQRMDKDMVVAWILNPQSISNEATMPAVGLTVSEAIALRDYLFLSDLQWSKAPPTSPPPTPVQRQISYAEVEERVFGKICVHCHMDPKQNEGRAGPGNAGGFGWPATGIELQSYEGIVAVADKIPAALLRRREEAARDAVSPGQQPASITRPTKPGMPLGLPPLSDEDIALVLGWIEQGMPQ